MSWLQQSVECTAPGGIENMREIKRLVTPDEVRVGAADCTVIVGVTHFGINYADVCVRLGLYASAHKYKGGFPIVGGFEVGGVVLAVQGKSQRVHVGQRVLAVSRFDCYTTVLVTDESLVFPLPPNLSLAEAAALPAASLTALYALELAGMVDVQRELDVRARTDTAAPPPAGRTRSMLVHSAAGGVGSALVQLGLALGHRVVGIVGSSHKVPYLRSLGCTVVIDKSVTPSLRAACEAEAEVLVEGERPGFDAVFDANGAETLATSFDLVGPMGRLVVYGFHSMIPRANSWADTSACCGLLRLAYLARAYFSSPTIDPLTMTASNRSVMAFNLSFLFDVDRPKFLQRFQLILGLVEDGKVKPPTVRLFPWRDDNGMLGAAAAHRAMESGQSVGKLVVSTGRWEEELQQGEQ